MSLTGTDTAEAAASLARASPRSLQRVVARDVQESTHWENEDRMDSLSDGDVLSYMREVISGLSLTMQARALPRLLLSTLR